MKPDPVGWPWLRTPAAKRVIDQLWPDEVAEREQLERNEAAVKRHINEMLDRREAEKSTYPVTFKDIG